MRKKLQTSPLMERIGKKLKELRNAQGTTQEELAEQLDVNVSYVGQMERGEREASLKTLEKIAATFNLPASEFLTEKGADQKNTWIQRYEKVLHRCNTRQLAALYETLLSFLPRH